MDDSAETVHVAFGESIPETLRKALPLLGSEARVIGLPDPLSVGPIDSPILSFARLGAQLSCGPIPQSGKDSLAILRL